MNWLKVHHGMPSDPKWAVVAKRAAMPRHAVVAVWCSVLDHASQNTPRGSVAGLDVETVAVSLDLEIEQVEAIVAAFGARGLIENNAVSNWMKRQTGTSTERVRRYRERGTVAETQNETSSPLRNDQETASEPIRNDNETPVTREQSREEQTREEKKEAAATARDPACELIELFDEVRLGIFGLAQARAWPGAQDISHARRWRESGVDLEMARVVFRARMAEMRAKGRSPPRNLAYFEQPIADALEASKRPMPQGQPNDPLDIPQFLRRGPSKTDRAKAAVLRAAVAGGYAPEQSSGEEGTGDDPVSVLPVAQAIRQGA